MPVDAVRVRFVDDVVLVFIEPERDLDDTEIERWYEGLRRPEITKTVVLSVGPIRSEANRRRRTVETLKSNRVRVIAVTDHKLNRGLIGLFSWLGVAISGYPWSRLEDAARDVAARSELVEPIVRAALALRAESPAAVGLAPDEG